MRIVPNSDSALLREFNPHHVPAGSSKGGQFASTAGGTPTKYIRPPVIQVRSIDHAIRLIQQGKVVELPNTRSVNTLLQKLAAMGRAAAARGEEAPYYELCNVSVRGTNIFCGQSLGLDRLAMPQLNGFPAPGSIAATLPKDRHGKVDGTQLFLGYLNGLGIKTTQGTIPAAKLKASQSELNGAKVAGMVTNPTFDPHAERIFTSRDDYVIDGHHRWAAVVTLDAKDNRLGDIRMKVERIDAPISEILKIAKHWTATVGILPASTHDRTHGVG